ncbi:MAG TPA: hypothetical protein VHJ82_05090 [Actinomycetota bacterium]|nr:hypothetical protein [Actinomycetota bacterium]
MNPIVRVFGVTALLALMVVLLGKPILDAAGGRATAREGGPRSPAPVLPTPTPTTAPPEETPTPPPTQAAPGEPLLVGQFPDACLQQADAVEGAGLVAAWHENRVQIAATDGNAIAELPDVRPPIQWSASGRFLVTRGPQLWTSEGESLGPFIHLASGAEIAAPDRGVAWSPVADCALVMVGDSAGSPEVSLLVARPSVDPIELLRGDIRDVAFSPDGDRLAFVAKQGGRPAAGFEVWSLDLESGTLNRLLGFEDGSSQVVLGGWAGADILYWAAPGVSVAADGWELSGVSGNGAIRVYTRGATMLTGSPPSFLEPCADRLVGVLGGDRSFDPTGSGQTRSGSPPRLAFLEANRRPEFITPEGETYYSPTCSPDDRYLVAIAGEGAARRLTLLDSSGAFLRTLTIDEGYADKLAVWGPSGTGVLFQRAPSGGGADVLWFIAEGAPARSLNLNVASFDWSAERPSGLLGE